MALKTCLMVKAKNSECESICCECAKIAEFVPFCVRAFCVYVRT